MTGAQTVRAAARSARGLPDLILIATVVFASLPLSFTLDMRVGSIPVMNGFVLATVIATSFSYVTKYRGNRFVVIFYALAGVFMTAIMLATWDESPFEQRTALQDISCYCGLPIGVALAQLKGKDEFHSLLKKCYVAICITFAFSLVLLLTGYVESIGSGGREIDGAMFTSSFLIAMAFPCLWSRARLNRPLEKGIAFSGMALTIFFAVISATRSVFITVVISLICTAVVEIKRNPRNLIWMGAASLLLAGAAISGTVPGLAALQQTQLGDRLAATDYAKEDRFEELTSMLDSMGPAEWARGAGFGSGFPSPIPEGGIATVPHIGITTVLYKGGAPAMIFLILGPCLLCLWKLSFAGRSPADPFLAGVAVYVVQASLSGGWAFLPLTLLGSFLYLGLEKRNAASTKPLRIIQVRELVTSPSGGANS
ncbi:MAG: hypothetical protein ABJC09_13005 [Terriglobia bacterium]